MGGYMEWINKWTLFFFLLKKIPFVDIAFGILELGTEEEINI